MPTPYVTHGLIAIARELYDFVENEVLPGLSLNSMDLWAGAQKMFVELTPINRYLLAKRERLQSQIDGFHRTHKARGFSASNYQVFLREIGYISEEGPEFTIETTGLDREIATVCGPQLVAPISNKRYSLNAANARWGSLYDSLYGSDALAPVISSTSYDTARGAETISYVRDFLDQSIPLANASHHNTRSYRLENSVLVAKIGTSDNYFADPSQFVGFTGSLDSPKSLLFVHHGLHIELKLDANSQIGALDKANICDVIIESALTTIQDFEDSVACVDAEDKVMVYRNWLGLIRGDLTEHFDKGGKKFVRTLNGDRRYQRMDGGELVLPGRSLLLVRNVGHLMTNDAILLEGQPAPEGILDALMTSLISLHDLNGKSIHKNSRTGAIYIVKPKMHGAEEAAFTDVMLQRVETLLGLAANTIKVGVMDEERRTSVNLQETIRAVKSRIFFINTGFLDRTGDEIHTDMEAGPVVRKAEIRNSLWIKAYEEHNVDSGLRCGFSGRAQIGKGMWAMPDLMAAMLKTKGLQLMAGASTAWVPSSTAATLHALHYHQIDVLAQQRQLLEKSVFSQRRPQVLADLLTPLLELDQRWSKAEILEEVDNNVQGILGYVVRWIDQGIGCSKIPDIHNLALMEDRATLRISSQHIANWLHHGICSHEEVRQTLYKNARIVDQQNVLDPVYVPMAPTFDGPAFRAAADLIFSGRQQPSGYTELLLHHWRKIKKAKSA